MPRKKRKALSLQPGSSAYYEDEHYVVLQILDLNYLLAQNVQSRDVKKLRISDVNTAPKEKLDTLKSSLIEILPDKDWQIAQQRFEIIQPLVNKYDRTASDVEAIAKKHDLHMTTIYKWLKRYESDGLLTGLSPKTRSDSGITKLSDEVEEIIRSCIEEEYLTGQRKKVSAVYRTTRIQLASATAGLIPNNT